MAEGTNGRRCLPERRHSWTQKARIAGQTIHVGFGEYDDGTLGEIWIDVHKAGTSIREMMHEVAVFASTSLQHGLPLEAVIANLKCLSFPPQGEVEGACLEYIRTASSILDLVGQIIEYEYPGGKRRLAELDPATLAVMAGEPPPLQTLTDAPEPPPKVFGGPLAYEEGHGPGYNPWRTSGHAISGDGETQNGVGETERKPEVVPDRQP